MEIIGSDFIYLLELMAMRLKILAILTVLFMAVALICLGILLVQTFAAMGTDPQLELGDRSDPEPTSNPMPPEPEQEPDPPPQLQVPQIFVGQRLIIPVPTEPVGKSLLVREGLADYAPKQIALTFDAGWLYDQTRELLDVLDKHQVKSTFFLRGLWVQDHPELAREILNRGHCLENHSLTHGHMAAMKEAEIRHEIAETTRLIQETTGYTPYLFRPPYGEYNDRLLKTLGEEGYPFTIMWTVDSHDWARELNGKKITRRYVVDRVLSNAGENGIVLMHIGGYETVGALPEIITGLREQGFTLVRVNDMLPPPAVHTVVPGETLPGIAQAYGVTIEEIIKINNLD